MKNISLLFCLICLLCSFAPTTLLGQCQDSLWFTQGWELRDRNGQNVDSLNQLIINCGTTPESTFRSSLLQAYRLKDQNLDSAHALLDPLIPVLDELQLSSKEKGLFYLTYGFLLTKDGEYENSREKLSIARTYFQADGITWGVAQAIDDEAVNMSNLGHDSLALQQHLRALSIRDSIGDDEGRCRSWINIGTYYFKRKEYNKAKPWYVKARTMAQHLDHPQLLLNSTINYAATWYAGKPANLDSASYLWSSLIPVTEKLGYLRQQANIYNNLGLVQRQLKNYDRALSYFESARSGYEKIGYERGVASYHNNCGKVYLKQGLYGDAATSFNKYLALSKELQLPRSEQRAYQNLQRTYSAMGNHEKSLQYYKQYISIRDSISNAATEIKIADLQSQFDNQQLQITNTELEKGGLIKDLTILTKSTRIENMIIWIISLGGGCLLLALTLFFFRYRERAKQQLLEKENEVKLKDAMLDGQESERDRIASELHDSLGSILSATKHQLESIDDRVGKIIDQGEQVKKANTLLLQAVDEVRRISHNMSSEILENFGLVAAVTELTDSVKTSQGLIVNLLAVGFEEEPRLATRTELVCYRVLQELMQNTIKHANAGKMSIKLYHQKTFISIVVKDDGAGFDWEAAKQKGGIGLRNVENRVNYLQGTCTFKTSPGNGTLVTVQIPLV
jgi:two-component system NarL family sensor kinase